MLVQRFSSRARWIITPCHVSCYAEFQQPGRRDGQGRESTGNPTVAYAIDKTDCIVTEENIDQLPEQTLAEWEAACDEFEAMSEKKQEAWIQKVLSGYPTMEELPDLDSYNLINRWLVRPVQAARRRNARPRRRAAA